MSDEQPEMLEKRPWKEFQDAGLLWWANRDLHLVGWALVAVQEKDGSISDVYPARCKFRGFSEDVETEGFKKLTAHIEESLERMKDDLKA